MNPRCLAAQLLAFALALFVPRGVAAESPELRSSITRALQFLDREGDRWMDDKDCTACHHLPLLILDQREALRRGFKIDETKLSQTIRWAEEREGKTNDVLEAAAFMKLALSEAPATDAMKLIVQKQLADGSWKPAGQFASMQRRELAEATENSARLLLLALGRSQDVDAEAARAGAAALLQKVPAAKSVETLVFRLLYSRCFGPPGEGHVIEQEIAGCQRADGGWAWWRELPESDSLGTGQALYALSQSADPEAQSAAASAEAWLLSHQREDGGWAIDPMRISKIDRSKPEKAQSLKNVTDIYTFWGSAWATLGLLQRLPESSP